MVCVLGLGYLVFGLMGFVHCYYDLDLQVGTWLYVVYCRLLAFWLL